tara:strand:+ start:5668 stop:6810 length:1143 start_codon:yes stop_codon:yes gene_type:complete
MNQSDTPLSVADRYNNRNVHKNVFGLPKKWPIDSWVHLIHNWRTGGSSLTALLSVNFHDSYLKVGHPFTRDGWPVDYSLDPYQVTKQSQLMAWIRQQQSPSILAGHTYYGMPKTLNISEFDLWVTMREPAARLNSGLLRFYRKPLKSSNSQGGYVGDTKGHDFSSSTEIEQVALSEMSHELNGMCRRIAGYSITSNFQDSSSDDLESCKSLDDRSVDRRCFDLALAHLETTKWIYLTEQVLPSILMLEQYYNLSPLIHPCSHLIHNPQWNGAGVTRLQESLLTNHRHLLESLNHWDVQLYAEASKIFWKRWKDFDIDPARLEARRALQSKPLIHPNKLRDSEAARQEISQRIEHRSRKARTKSVGKWILEDGFNAMFWPS